MKRKWCLINIIVLLGIFTPLHSQTINGKIYGGGEIALVDGDTKVEVYSGTIGDPSLYNGGVFGGGLGQTTVVTGNVEVLIGKIGSARDAAAATIKGDVYGGSALGNVNCTTAEPHTATADKSTSVSLNAGVVYGSIYGGALGQTDPAIAANVYGPVQVNVYGGNVFATDGTGANGSGGVFGCNNLNGEPKDSVHVDIYGTNSHDDNGTDDYDDDSYAVFSVYGGGNQADYSSGTPHVTVHNCDNSIKYVYGGGNAAHLTHSTNGHTDVVIYGGNRIGDVFGGGNGQVQAANIGGNTNVTIYGGEIGNVFGGSNSRGIIGGVPNVSISAQAEAESEACHMDIVNVYGGGNMAASNAGHITIWCTGEGTIDNVYGGANEANVEGDIVLNINGGNIGNVFGGNNTRGNISGAITVNVNKSDDCDLSLGYVYGAGNLAAYTPTTPGAYPAVNILKGTVTHDVFGGGLGASAVVTSNPAVTISGGAVSGNVYGGGSAASVVGSTAVSMTSGSANNIYGGGLGNATNVSGNVAVTVSGGTVTEDVYGGSGFGTVNTDTENTTTVIINNDAHVGRDVFGGGFGQKADNDAVPAIPAYEADVNGNVSVIINKGAEVGGNVYGGNNTNGSPKGNITVLVDGPANLAEKEVTPLDLNDVFGGGKHAATYGIPSVVVRGCETVVDRVFGGGDAASVPSTNVTIWGGRITDAFGGGNGESVAAHVGYEANGTTEYTLGTGNVSLTIKGGSITNTYGGSNTLGNIRGSVSVTVDKDPEACDIAITNLYGGGNEADGKAGTITIACTGDGTIDNVYGGANNADVDGDIVLNINGGNIGNVFGGNNSGGSINGGITVNVDWDGLCGSNSLTNVYGGGNQAAYGSAGTPRGPVVNIRNATIEGDVFGGGLGESATVTGNPQVNVNTDCANGEHSYSHKAVVNGSVYGGGSAAPVVGNPTVTTRGMDGDDKKVLIRNHVFGGGLGSTAIVTGSTRVNIYGNTEIEQNVYGGGNGGVVQGDTNVTIGENCASH